jgi:hypothetical protein
MSNVPDPSEELTAPDKSIRHGPLLTFNPLPPIAEDGDSPLVAADNQAKLM